MTGFTTSDTWDARQIEARQTLEARGIFYDKERGFYRRENDQAQKPKHRSFWARLFKRGAAR